jgi:outer membrane protein W
MKKPAWMGLLVMAMMTAGAASAQAQVTQSVNLGVGYFMVRGEESRDANDVLLEDLQSLAFEVKDFNGPLVNGEWLIGFGDRLEVGLGAGFYQRTVPSVYVDFVDGDGSEIEQDLKLRVVPLTATVKFLPFGRPGDFQPYAGGGIALLNWRYSEVGEFVDFSDGSIFFDRYTASGSTIAPIVFGGVRVPVSGDVFAFNGELRWQGGKGELPADSGLLTDTIDLGGISAIASFQIRF